MLQLPVLLHYLFLKRVFNVEHLQNAYIAFFVVVVIVEVLKKSNKGCKPSVKSSK